MIRTRRCPQFAAALLSLAAVLSSATQSLFAQDSAAQDPAGSQGPSASQKPVASQKPAALPAAAHEEARPKGAGNRLARETSPYLLLHAHNPVDWYPWGPEAFEKARAEGKLIFLSIGYSSCYWCHVMERKVFSNEEIAAYMNQHFVNVKVDREERPDVDDIYMTALSVYFQLIGAPQGGGWPLSMFLTPEGKPVVGGTYFPPDDEDGRIGFPTVMRRMQGLWETETESLRTNADTITGYVRQVMQPRAQLTPVTLERKAALGSVKALKESFDPEYGGVDYTPDEAETSKFPVPAKLALLLYEADRHDDAEARRIVLSTLDHIAAGGIRDHLGGGFHRYSTDRFWLVPHFEKMLYDNAQLADLFVAAFQSTENPRYRQVAEEIFTYVLRDMTSPQGAFYSAQDAETDAVEGKYYVWSAEELDRILGDGAPLFRRAYGAAAESPFEYGYVLHLPRSLEELAKSENLSLEELTSRLQTMRQDLLAARRQREAPLLDDKILTSWNGLMIRALARGGAAFERPDLIEAAEKAARFVLDHMRDDQGRLLRTHRAETAKLNAYLDDYAFFIDGLLALYHASGDEQWRTAARQLCDQQIALFWDEARDGFFFTSHHHEELLARTKNAYDAVLPSGNSVSVRNLVELSRLAGDDAYRDKAERTLKLFVPKLDETPTGMTNLALALEEFLDDAPSKTSAASYPPGATHASTVRRATLAGNAPGSIVQVQVFKPQQPPATAGRPSTEETPPAGEPSPGDPAAEKKPQYVKFQAHLSVDKLPPGKTCDVIFLIDIQPGWHINTNPAQPDYLIPTQITAKSKLGVKLTGIVYPKGKRLEIPGAEEPQHAYEKRVAIRGKLTVPAEAAGRVDELVLTLKYQACNEQVCLPPETAQIAGKVPVALSLTEVKQINEKLFALPKAPSRPGEENRASPPPNAPRKP